MPDARAGSIRSRLHRWRSRHHWWHTRRTWNGWNGYVYLWCRSCGVNLATAIDNGFRCSVCGGAFCDEMEHH